MQAGNTACNYRTRYRLVLSHKTYQNQGISDFTIAYCYVSKTFVARNKFPHVKVARNTKKVGQACPNPSSLSALYVPPCLFSNAQWRVK